ncbi:hypothetical protein [Hyphomicrobium sp.]|uniref:hypothetical protein n=1 Tax=Hyphomicrobium sp. TaxID=82 RepID=UPI000F97A66D|nr:hypothetical protein [Hyphomicrobium sp.]RUO97998.1 MAG: hypothetical protein EKK30_14845 [Hyphomicrobium sp.]
MNEQTLRARLEEADEIVFTGDLLIAAQLRAITEMSVKGLPTASAEDLLVKFEELHALHVAHRDSLLTNLNELLARRAPIKEFEISRQVKQDGTDIMPRFIVFCPNEECSAFIQLPEDAAERVEQLQVMKLFMIHKSASGFILCSELIEPNCLFCAAVTRTETLAAIQRIKRGGKFGRIEWQPPECVDDVIKDLLPPKSVTITKQQLELMVKAFDRNEVPGISWTSSPR